MSIQTTFQRQERKYVLDRQRYESMKQFLQSYMQEDVCGFSTICNIYYDPQQDNLDAQSFQKAPYKENFRIRSYGVPKEDSMVYLEIKKKWNNIAHKQRMGLSYIDAMKYLQYDITPQHKSQIEAEIAYYLQFYQPVPKVFLAYERESLQGILEEDVRITFDHNIRTRYHDLNLASGDYGNLLFEEEERILMEIKVVGAYPLWLSNELSLQQIFPISFQNTGQSTS